MPLEAKLRNRLETTVLEKRHWVRLTRACNNHCIFCLDSDCQNGSIIPFQEITEELKRGLNLGATRVILSGGDPTIHPEFIEIVKSASLMGYRWVQVITNGRMFAYPGFTISAIRAGINEVTISMHGHEPSLHDSLTMVQGSFLQSIAGIKNLLISNKCHVSIDIVINSQNYMHLTNMLHFFYSLGVREFDLLFIQPFGRASENPHLLLDERCSDYIKKAIKWAEGNKCHVWTNRVPAEYLEGVEEAIQDPLKILDDIEGRRELFKRSIENSRMPSCRGEKCKYCVLSDFCQYMESVITIISGINETEENQPLNSPLHSLPIKLEPPYTQENLDMAVLIWKKYISKTNTNLLPSAISMSLKENDLIEGNFFEQLFKTFPEVPVTLSIYGNPANAIPLNSGKIVSLAVEPEFLNVFERCKNGCERVLIARKTLTTGILKRNVQKIIYSPFIDMLKEISDGPDFSKTPFEKFRGKFIDIPPCISGNKSLWSQWPYINIGWFERNLQLNPMKLAKDFLQNLIRKKSMRCKICREYKNCKGVHINYLRKYGFKKLKPITNKNN